MSRAILDYSPVERRNDDGIDSNALSLPWGAMTTESESMQKASIMAEQMMLAVGADVNAVNNKGETANGLSASAYNEECVKLLREAEMKKTDRI